jgi:hypothetical protein
LLGSTLALLPEPQALSKIAAALKTQTWLRDLSEFQLRWLMLRFILFTFAIVGSVDKHLF